MEILTNKMKTARLDNNPTSCKLWLPCNEGSGDILTDLAGDVIVTDDVSAGHATAHAITFKATGAITSGSLPDVPDGKSIIMLDVLESGNLVGSGNAFTCSKGVIHTISMLAAAVIRRNSVVAVSASFQTQTNDEKFVRCMTFDGVSGVLNAYSGNDGVAADLDNTADASAHLGGLSGMTNLIIGGSLDDTQYYGLAIYVAETLPSAATIKEAMDWAYANWTVGHKYLPPQFAVLT